MNSNAIAAKRKVDSAFMKKGVFIAIMSGVTYGLYTGFLTLGMARGVWAADWYGANTSGLSVFAITYVLAALGSGVNDTLSGIWMVIKCAVLGELGDFFRVLKTKPGLVMIICALIGGIDGYALSPIQWIFAAIMVIGIAMVGNLNPLNAFKKKEA